MALWLAAIGYFLPSLFVRGANAQYIPGPKTTQVIVIAAVLLIMSTMLSPHPTTPSYRNRDHRTPSHGSKDYGFEDYLRDNDPDSYEFYKDIGSGWNAGRWDPENGFAGG